MPRLLSLPILAVGLSACGADEVPPEGVWSVTVQSRLTDEGALDTDCIESGQNYQKSYNYELYYDGDAVTIDIDGQAFATGTRAGCDLVYESTTFLDDRASGLITWAIEGDASYHGAAGGCENQIADDGLDWVGVETVVVVASEDESIPVGCQYFMDTSGTWKGTGGG